MSKHLVSVRAFCRPDGGRTTIKLERDFWEMLDNIARYQCRTYLEVLQDIEQRRGKNNRANAIRSYILQHFYERAVSSQSTLEGHHKLDRPFQNNHVQSITSPMAEISSTKAHRVLPSNMTSKPEPMITEYTAIYMID